MARTMRFVTAGAAVIALSAAGYAVVTSSRLDRAATLARDLPFVIEAYYRSGLMWDDELLMVT